jgi:uncharacterized protein YueI
MPGHRIADCYHDTQSGSDFSVIRHSDQTVESELARVRAEFEKHRAKRESVEG